MWSKVMSNIFGRMNEVVGEAPILYMSPKEVVEKIHAEFDSAYEREQAAMQKLIDGLEIPTEVEVEQRASRLKALGFENAEVVRQAQKFEEKRKTIETERLSLFESAKKMKMYQEAYRFQKIISFKELQRICKKYGLIYAPVSAYKGDVPDKNITEIENAAKVRYDHVAKDLIYGRITKFYDSSSTARKVKNMLSEWCLINDDFSGDGESTFRHYLYEQGIREWGSRFLVSTAEKKKIIRSGYHICAPKSDFNTKGLEMDEFGYTNVITRKIEDPIVFDFLKHGYCRVISKWGLEASDPALINPTNN